jgi:hypothetical protein
VAGPGHVQPAGHQVAVGVERHRASPTPRARRGDSRVPGASYLPRMSFSALHTWNTSAADALSQLEVAHSAVGGTAAGRRTNTLQLNYAFVLLLSAHFQAFCRDLHTQMTRALSATLAPAIGDVLRVNLTFSRQLDVRNAQPGSLGADFNRFGLAFWPAVEGADRRNRQRREKLNQLNEWRNAIAHHDIASRGANLTPREVTLDACKDWRSALNGLASSCDRVLTAHLKTLAGPTTPP